MKKQLQILSLCFLVGAGLLFGTGGGNAQVVTNPLVTGAQGPERAGSGTSTFRSSGLFANWARSVADTALLNDWNVVTIPIPANTLSVNGHTARLYLGYLGANNANTHEIQAYYAASTSVCSGTGAAMCTTGCLVLPGITNAAAFANQIIDVAIVRTAAATQDYLRFLNGNNTATAVGTCAIDTTAATKFVFGSRNTTAAAASIAQITYAGFFYAVP